MKANSPTDLLLRIERDLQELRVLIGAPESAPHDLTIPRDLISVDAAAALGRVKPDTVRKWARSHPYNGNTGFGVTLGCRWHIARRPYLEFVRRNQK